MAEKEIGIKDLPGVGPATAQKLEEAGYNNLISIAVATPGELIEASGLTENAARKVINAARKSASMGFESGQELLEKRAKVIKLTTGSKAFDALMEGGFESGAITECYGQFGSAKCIDKDTVVFYFNPSKPHLQTISQMYEKYKTINGEKHYDEGYVVPINSVEVIGLTDEGLKKTKASYLYKMHSKRIYEIKTKRGRTIKLSGSHKLLTFDNGVKWKPSKLLEKGDVLACPNSLTYVDSDLLSEDDAYFLGLFVAEGTKNPLSIATGSDKLKKWLMTYVFDRFGYKPLVRVDKRRTNFVYSILLKKPTKDFLERLAGCTAGDKFVPESVFLSSQKIIESFLAGYLDGDGYLAKDIASMTTKSKELVVGLSYLFKRLGVSVTYKPTYVEDIPYHKLYVCGDDRLPLNNLPLKIKAINYSARNSAYGYSGKIVKYIRENYRSLLGGNRGSITKPIGRKLNRGDTFYNYFTNSSQQVKTLNENTLTKVRQVFYDALVNVNHCLESVNKLDTLSQEQFRSLHYKLPFAFNSLAKDLGLTKSGIRNYVARSLPKDRSKLKERILTRLIGVKEGLIQVLKTLKNVAYFDWDIIESIKGIGYNDYIYDLVVPEGHSFIGGNMPLVLHNTQIGHQLAVNIQLPKEKGGADGMAVYIDTENTFRPERIKQMAEGAGLNSDEALKNIKVARAYNSDHQMLLLDKVEDLIVNDKLPIKLVIVDSLIGHFRSEFIGRGTLANRQQKLNKHMHALLRLADLYGVVVYVTNQVSSDPAAFFGDPTKPVGGNIMGHASTFRIYLRKGKKGSRVAKLVDAPATPDGECIFNITTEGIRDV